MTRETWYADGLRFECTQCGNCCKNHGSYAFVYLAPRDVSAISAHLELGVEEFLARYCRFEDGWITLRMDAPACPFLAGGARCSIYPVRPMQCRTWPFWQENLDRETWEGAVSACCPGIGTGRSYTAEEVAETARQNEDWYEA